MTRSLALLATAAASLALAACETETIVAGNTPDDMADELANAAPVELPPAVKETKTYRCKDNSLVYVEFFAGDLMANVRTVKDGPPTMLKTATVGEPLVAEGYSLTGGGPAITLTTPGKSSQSCKA